MEPASELIDALLDQVEQLELLSLRWGHVDGSLAQSEVDSLAAAVIASAEAAIPPDALVEAMVDAALLLEFSGTDGYRYRSRFAEGVRLLTRLKQSMPKRPWLSSPDLVSDYRVDARPRSLPKRDIALEQALAELEDVPTFDDLRRTLVEAFVGLRQLSGFQVRAAKAILRNSSRDHGTVLTSGTGSGKTLAFYLPLATELGPLNRRGDFWTKAVAVFPRVELLKDQFTQAHKLLAPMSASLTDPGYRPFRLGTFFGGTPFNASPGSVRGAGWARTRSGFVCPFLTCPECGEDLVWLDEDITAQREVLSCATECGAQVDERHVVLTRWKAQREPPDILFTTAESLNQRLSDTYSRPLFGIHSDPSRRARYLLLDEIHTYGGTSGAQAAMVLRRWRHARAHGEPVKYVGLSATLEEAPAFFATLTGLAPQTVTEVTPHGNEFEFIGKEYQLVLRGDLSSRTQLLSTTIQTCFLLSRLLDPLDSQSARSGGRYGARVFAFTDDLDATNRLFDFLRDAEGMDIFGRPDASRDPLAALRAANLPDRQLRVELGQDWASLERWGGPLTRPLTIARTSSQDRGVSASADVVVATAALEVGFNDPQVGAVVQHKAPHRLANFVQRKGRAGRSPEMRPWTVTVLSDFGRDRLMYQSYDRLFDPVLRPFTLPVRNRYILRMQAGFAMLDWLAAANDEQETKGWWWPAVSRPAENARQEKQHHKALDILNEVLETPGQLRNDLVNHVRRALKLETDDETNEVLWGAPRSLMLEVLPTLVRRLETNWQLHPDFKGTSSQDLKSEGYPHPLPDFLPRNLFSDLNLPEVAVKLPPATVNDNEKVESMEIADAINRLVPGRVTRRFAPERGKLNHWIPVPLQSGEYRLRISGYAQDYEPVATIPVELDGAVTDVICYRPWRIQMEIVRDADVRSTSNGRQVWRNHFVAEGDPLPLPTGNDPQWGQAIGAFYFYLHATNSHLVVRRYCLEANATVKRSDADSTELDVTTLYIDSEGNRAAIGFEQEVDAIRVAVNLPAPGILAELADVSDHTPAWRSAYFRELVMEDPELSSVGNWFQRDRLHRAMLLAITQKAITEQTDLTAVLDGISTVNFATLLSEAASQSLPQDLSDVGPNHEETPGELEEEIRGVSVDVRWQALLSSDVTQDRLLALAREMCNPDPYAWGEWLRQRIHETLAQAVLAAAHIAAPEHLAEASLIIDLNRGEPHYDPGDAVEIWLTESAIGGSGAVEALARKASEEPGLLIRILEAVIAPDEAERTSEALDRLIGEFVSDPDMAYCVLEVRSQASHSGRFDALQNLYRSIGDRGIYAENGLKVSLNHRVLRAGTHPDSDDLLRELVQAWRDWESELRLGIDLQSFCSIAASHPEFADRSRQLLAGSASVAHGPQDVEGLLYGLLWPRKWEARAKALQSYQPFCAVGYTDPALIRDLLLEPAAEPIEFGEQHWNAKLLSALAGGGVARVRVPCEREAEFEAVIFQLLGTPVEVDYLQLYPIISKHEMDDGAILTFVLKEMF